MITSITARTGILIGLIITTALVTISYFWKSPKNQVPVIQQKSKKKYRVKPAAVVFDLNGVLFTVNRNKAVSQLGLLDILSYTIGGNDVTKLEHKIFDLLHRMQPLFKTSHCSSHKEFNEKLIPHHNDQPLPHVMRDWMQGELTGQEILDKAIPFIDTLDEEGFFASNLEKKLVRKSLKMFFDLDTRCKLYKPIKAGVKLVKKCKDLNHKVYLLSNIDTQFIDMLKDKYPEIFDLFDGMIVSAEVKAIKPYPTIYKKLISDYRLDPATCYMIDDQAENIEGAQHAGMKGIQCDFHHYKDVRTALREAKVLPQVKQKKLVQTA